MAIDILESKVVGTNKETWYKLIGTKDDTKPTGEFPAGSGHTVAKDSTYFEIGTEIRYEFDGSVWNPKGQVPTELQDKTVTPTTEQQAIQADDGYDGLDTVTVEAVTAAIDANIQSENIKQGKTILGVPGSLNVENNAMFGINPATFSVKNNLVSVNIPSGVTSINSSAFSEFVKLSTVNIPSSVTSIGQSAFYKCTKLATIEIPASVTSIENGAFNACSNLRSIIVNKPEGSIEGAPWGAPNATVIWTG